MSMVDAPTHHWTVEEYEKLGEGFFGRERVELLNGQIIERSPIGYRHAEAADRLNEFFGRKAKNRYRVRIQGIQDYWLLNLQADVLEIYRGPVGDQSTSLRTSGSKELLSPLAFPDIKLRIGDFIP